ncbi:uncharacterized protein LOC143531763 [Bidens hawaiensis]|uniref:uncharacterized protein LOC143531763 n=1 Tax=Bidens hawaiensis TaxID=980011 RepID=UPI0040493274
MDSSSSSRVNADVDSISVEFSQHLDLNRNGESTSQLSPDLEAHHEEHEHEDDDDDFTFMLIGNDDAPIHEDKLLPLFDQKLLLDDGEYELEEIENNRLPIMPPVDKIFIESPRGLPSSESERNEDDISTGEYCAWSGDLTTATAELSKKSNSTGFSKLWRLKEKVGRSYSDGRDAFVFLKSCDKSATATSSSAAGTFVKVTGGKARVVKQRKPTAYLRSRGEYTEEERKRSYLPYRPEMLGGLFTNVHGGLTKNVHPY